MGDIFQIPADCAIVLSFVIIHKHQFEGRDIITKWKMITFNREATLSMTMGIRSISVYFCL
jgi:hypothetical protein